ncbi:SagB/ThcOx family dehydrogenase [Legionella jordanis]|uniref:Nitroreductase n=2 Tax=Legionella jordanis TaxID=456 RepID=A0A0W0VDP2_9GAMM|nr:SagB/ThcOx family dehydrogenase [Legionella jordanis]KTD18273.1 nitroreductase [Legionella jordanis]RMX05191.1 SagB/ThcOx family dehydrogenase [Legionella jordanis]RMX17447.1 SagB/ThcOx family dehydrogenase [Legionella jordanis]VEH13384.1 nitroreductase [Legionella jordanis]
MEFFRRNKVLLLIISLLICLWLCLMPKKLSKEPGMNVKTPSANEIKLANPAYTSNISIEEALNQRRSIREFKNKSVNLQQIAQLLWASQGITSKEGFRTAPSAGALYPLEIYLVSGNIEKLPAGIYHYIPATHSLYKIKEGDVRNHLAEAALGQEVVRHAAASIVITAEFSQTINKYGEKGKQFVFMEAGHAAQNIYLQSISLALGTVSVGAFDENQLKIILGIKEIPLYILPVGRI